MAHGPIGPEVTGAALKAYANATSILETEIPIPRSANNL